MGAVRNAGRSPYQTVIVLVRSVMLYYFFLRALFYYPSVFPSSGVTVITGFKTAYIKVLIKYDLFRTQILCSKLTALSLTAPAGMNRRERFCPWLGSWREPEWEIRLNGPNHRCRKKDGPSKY